jgi:hypothetical protein
MPFSGSLSEVSALVYVRSVHLAECVGQFPAVKEGQHDMLQGWAVSCPLALASAARARRTW